jgi:hypothetical protein
LSKRIAIIYTGHLRTWDKCRENQKANLWTEDTDLFFHTYEEPSHTVKQFVKIPQEYHIINEHKYNDNRRPETSVGNTMNQWHNNFIGFCIVPNNYDIYVRCRADTTFSSRIDLNSYDYSDSKIYIPHGHNYYDGINDQVAWGNYETMKKYYSVYLNHADIFKDGVTFHTEGYVTENMKRQGLNIVRVPIDNFIIRQ